MQNQFVDAVALSGTRLTSDGYLVGEVKCARTGVQIYRGAEMGLVDHDTVRVYRPESAVFAKDSLATFAGKPVTMGHPSELVTAANWKALAVGDIGEEIARDGEFVRVSIKLMDAAAIKAVQDGTREVSMGYTTGVEMQDGKTPEGEAYDAVQTGPIKINHLAIVPKGRAGSECRIGDSADARWGASPIIQYDRKDASMTDHVKTRTVLIDGLSVETTDAGAQALEKLTKQIEAKDAHIADADKAHKAAIEAKDEEVGKLKADLKAAKDAAPDQAAIDKMVADRATLVATVAQIAKDVKPVGLSDADLRKAAVAAKLGDDAVADVSDAEIKGMFAVISKDAAKGDPVVDAIKDAKPALTLDAAYSERNAALADAWKQPMKQEA